MSKSVSNKNQFYARAWLGAKLAALILCYLVLLVGAQTANQVAANEDFVLTADKLHSEWEGELNRVGWLYKAGDDAGWAARDYDDSSWEKLKDTQLDTKRLPREGWTGIAWFRLHINVDEKLAGEPVALRLYHWGASEIYLDGKLLQRFGKVVTSNDASNLNGEAENNPRAVPVPLTFQTGGAHVIAVRYSFAATQDLSKGIGSWLARARFAPGFTIYIQTARGAIAAYIEYIGGASNYKLFAGILYAFALLHFLLFVFYRTERTNLFYSLFAFSLASAGTFSNIANNGSQSAIATAIIFILFVMGYGAAFLALQAFLYEAFSTRFSRFFWFTGALLIGLAVILALFVRARITLYATCVFLVISLADSLRLVVLAVARRRDGARIIAGGVLFFAVGIVMLITRELQFVQNSQLYAAISDLAVIFAVPVAVSVFLARNFARTNKNLQLQLAQVQQLSVKQIELARTEAELRVQHEKERAENERRAKELEEARQLQLSMLPKTIPQFPNLEIAAFMKPATEVGGDYYDFHIAEDETLTVVIGDATGHGLKAGTVVTATKSLFNAYAAEPDVTRFLQQSSRALKLMNLRGLFMSLTILKIKDSRVHLSSAGMPALLIYRQETRAVEEIMLKGMPLGSLTNYAYKQREFCIASGDCILLMSDGFPERFNADGEMLGYEKARQVLSEIADLSAPEIINRFVSFGDDWANAKSQDDDVTFVVIKAK